MAHIYGILVSYSSHEALYIRSTTPLKPFPSQRLSLRSVHHNAYKLSSIAINGFGNLLYSDESQKGRNASIDWYRIRRNEEASEKSSGIILVTIAEIVIVSVDDQT